MNILQKKSLDEINSDIYKLINTIKIKDNKIILLGSSSLKSQQYFSDYDFYSSIKDKPNTDEAYKIFSDILDKIKNYNNCYFIELKLQKKNGNKKKFNKIDDFNKKDFDKFYKDIDIIKIDLIFFTDYEFIEVSIIYNFNTDITDKEEYIKNINKDITELKDEGNYYKVLKRLFSIYKLNNDRPKLLYLSKIFNSILGKQYKKISNLNTLLLLLNHYKDDDTLKKVEINLKAIKEPTSTKDIKKNQDKYYNKLNEEAKYYYDELTKKSKPNLQYA